MKGLNACREIWIISYSLFLFILLSGCLVTVGNVRCSNGVHILRPSWISLPFLGLFSAICVFAGILIEFYILCPSEVFQFYNKWFQFYNNWKSFWFLVFISVGMCLCSAHSRAFLWNFSGIIISKYCFICDVGTHHLIIFAYSLFNPVAMFMG